MQCIYSSFESQTSDATFKSQLLLLSSSDTSNSHQPGNAKPQGRTLAGVLSGAAANLRSKLSNLNTAQELSTPAAATAASLEYFPAGERVLGVVLKNRWCDVEGLLLPLAKAR